MSQFQGRIYFLGAVALSFAILVLPLFIFADVKQLRPVSTKDIGEAHDVVSSKETLVLASLRFPSRIVTELEIAFVLDPNFHLCWESVPVNSLTRAGLLPWVKGLKDFFTGSTSLQVWKFLVASIIALKLSACLRLDD
jgi:hypothetical protein